jgi:hypothetical protein
LGFFVPTPLRAHLGVGGATAVAQPAVAGINKAP